MLKRHTPASVSGQTRATWRITLSSSVQECDPIEDARSLSPGVTHILFLPMAPWAEPFSVLSIPNAFPGIKSSPRVRSGCKPLFFFFGDEGRTLAECTRHFFLVVSISIKYSSKPVIFILLCQHFISYRLRGKVFIKCVQHYLHSLRLHL